MAESQEEPVGIVTVGVDYYAPFVFVNENGEYSGIDVDLAKEAFRRMGYAVRFQKVNWEKRDDLLDNESIDCIWCSYSMEGRLHEYHWAGPYMVSKQVVAVNPSSKIYHLSDLENKLIAVRSTSNVENILVEGNPQVPQIGGIYSFYDRDLMFASLLKGYVDGVASHEAALEQYMKDRKLDFRILPESLDSTGVGVAFSKLDRRPLPNQLDETLKAMLADGTVAKIMGRYLDNPEEFMIGGTDGQAT